MFDMTPIIDSIDDVRASMQTKVMDKKYTRNKLTTKRDSKSVDLNFIKENGITVGGYLLQCALQSSYMDHKFSGCINLTTVPLFDTSKVTRMDHMFYDCRSLTTVPLFDTSNVANMNNMFSRCESLESVPLFDTSNVTLMNEMFSSCYSLETVPLFDTSKVYGMTQMFEYCKNLTTIPRLDLRNITESMGMFNACYNLTECYLCNISCDLIMCDSSELSLDSIIHIIGELRNIGEPRTLLINSNTFKKIENIYVKTIEITDDMRAEDDLIDQKVPFVICESTDEGATLILDYAATKMWTFETTA